MWCIGGGGEGEKKIWWGKPKGKGSLGTPGGRGEVPFKRGIKKRGVWGGGGGGGEEDNKILMGKPEGKSSLGTPRSRWEDAIKMGIK